MKVYSEDTFEKLIVEHLVLHGGYEPRGQAIYDPAEALAIQAGYDIDRARWIWSCSSTVCPSPPPN